MEEAIWHNVITSRIGKAYSYQRTNTVCKRGYRSQKQQVVLEEEDKDEIHIVVLMRFRYIWYRIPKGLNLCVCVSIKTGCVSVYKCVCLQRPNLDVLINGKPFMRVTKNVYYHLRIELAHLLNLHFVIVFYQHSQ